MTLPGLQGVMMSDDMGTVRTVVELEHVALRGPQQRLAAGILLFAAAACSKDRDQSASASPARAPSVSVRQGPSLIAAIGDSALRTFVPDLPFTDRDGSCRRLPRASTRTASYAANGRSG